MEKRLYLLDSELVLLLKQGDIKAYTEIYNRFFGLLYIFVHKKLKDEDDAKDIVQEMFAGIWEKRESLNFSNTLASYLFTAVRNKMLDVICRKDVEGRYIKSLGAFMEQAHEQADHLVREKQLSKLIEEGIASLPTKMREVFLLSRVENLSHREIGERLNLSEQTVRSHVKHALRILRMRLGLLPYIFLFFKLF